MVPVDQPLCEAPLYLALKGLATTCQGHALTVSTIRRQRTMKSYLGGPSDWSAGWHQRFLTYHEDRCTYN